MSSTPGILRLKGTTTSSSSKITKSKKKKQKPGNAISPDPTTTNDETTQTTNDTVPQVEDEQTEKKQEHDDTAPPFESDPDLTSPSTTKTEAELRHEALKRRRVPLPSPPSPPIHLTERNSNKRGIVKLQDRLRQGGQTGLKTHKERVEDLNRYLSGLSEHHDMPRIGPG